MTGKANILKLINKNFVNSDYYKDVVIPTAKKIFWDYIKKVEIE